MPVFADNSTQPSMENMTELKNQLNNQKQDINDLQKQILDLNQSLTDLENHGIKFGIDEQKLADAVSGKQLQWKQGDLIIASSTIIAFFGFGAFLTMRFTTPEKPELYKLLRGILYAIFGIQIVHLGFITYIVLNQFNEFSILAVVIITVILLVVIVKDTKNIFYLEYSLPAKKKQFRELAKDIVKTIEESTAHLQKTLDKN